MIASERFKFCQSLRIKIKIFWIISYVTPYSWPNEEQKWTNEHIYGAVYNSIKKLISKYIQEIHKSVKISLKQGPSPYMAQNPMTYA